MEQRTNCQGKNEDRRTTKNGERLFVVACILPKNLFPKNVELVSNTPLPTLLSFYAVFTNGRKRSTRRDREVRRVGNRIIALRPGIKLKH